MVCWRVFSEVMVKCESVLTKLSIPTLMIDISLEIRGRTASNLLSEKKGIWHKQVCAYIIKCSLEYTRMLSFKYLRKYCQVRQHFYKNKQQTNTNHSDIQYPGKCNICGQILNMEKHWSTQKLLFCNWKWYFSEFFFPFSFLAHYQTLQGSKTVTTQDREFLL